MCVGKLSFNVVRQFVFKICSDLEELAEVRVIDTKEVVEAAFSEQNNLYVKRNRFGFKRYCTDQTIELCK